MSKLMVGRLKLPDCHGHSYESVELALRFVAWRRFPWHLTATHRLGLAEVDLPMRSVRGQGARGTVHVTVLPWS